jgi:hypothetical protein
MSKILMAKDAAEKAMLAESNRTESLLREARSFAAGIVVVLGFQLLDLKPLVYSSSPWAKISGGLCLAALSLSLFFAFCSLRVAGYSNYPRGGLLWDNLKPEDVTEAAAEESLVQMLLKTREQNARLNDAKIRALYWCRWLLFSGIFLVAASQLLDAAANNYND